MIKRAYIDIFQALISGGSISDENRLNYRFMAALLDSAREKAIFLFNSKNWDL